MKSKIERLEDSINISSKIFEEIKVGSEVIEKEVKAFGNGGHIILPRRYLNKSIKVILG